MGAAGGLAAVDVVVVSDGERRVVEKVGGGGGGSDWSRREMEGNCAVKEPEVPCGSGGIASGEVVRRRTQSDVARCVCVLGAAKATEGREEGGAVVVKSGWIYSVSQF